MATRIMGRLPEQIVIRVPHVKTARYYPERVHQEVLMRYNPLTKHLRFLPRRRVAFGWGILRRAEMLLKENGLFTTTRCQRLAKTLADTDGCSYAVVTAQQFYDVLYLPTAQERKAAMRDLFENAKKFWQGRK